MFAAWKLGEYIDFLKDGNTRSFFELARYILYEIVKAIDEDEAASLEE